MFFAYWQNNSGGHDILDNSAGIGHHVIVEATDAMEANDRAVEIGLYFYGTETGRDCPCCGNRWSPAWVDNAGNDVPSIYGEPVQLMNPERMTSRPSGFVHYADGEFVPFA